MLLFQEYMHPGQHIEDKPVKEEFQVAKWIRKNVPIKRTKFLNHNVEYFTGKLTIKCENFLQTKSWQSFIAEVIEIVKKVTEIKGLTIPYVKSNRIKYVHFDKLVILMERI